MYECPTIQVILTDGQTNRQIDKWTELPLVDSTPVRGRVKIIEFKNLVIKTLGFTQPHGQLPLSPLLQRKNNSDASKFWLMKKDSLELKISSKIFQTFHWLELPAWKVSKQLKNIKHS